MTLPRISIVTPSFNQGKFIEETIRSVIDQDYPDIEYIVIDGGSTDETVDILRKYNDRIKYWVSEKDEGQSHAINKGFEKATGDICAYINSDDVYLPGAFRAIGESYLKQHWSWCCTNVVVGTSIQTGSLWEVKDFKPEEFYVQQLVGQQGVFWRSDVLKKPYFRKEFRYAMDADFFCRILLSGKRPALIRTTTSFFRLHDLSKTSQIDHVLAVEGRRLFREIYSSLDEKGRSLLTTAQRQKTIRQLSARLQTPEYNTRGCRRLGLSLMMLRNSRKSTTIRISFAQVFTSLKIVFGFPS
ncbi:MAG TPA: glycosyltransferase family 2 protein [Cyclobacteriaceae bacterium]|nr:glycosyltransferase family 2 protein [Cyclobacteriaceae bacterium]